MDFKNDLEEIEWKSQEFIEIDKALTGFLNNLSCNKAYNK
jgi:hypothetical protein